jgi:predicted ribosomally synthesized peptide with nif11-like leader
MAMNELVKFCTEYLPNHPEFKRSIDARGDERFAALAAVAQKAGFDFSADEVRAVLTGELSDTDLEGVAGGVVPRKQGGGQQKEYLTMVMSDVFITSDGIGGIRHAY